MTESDIYKGLATSVLNSLKDVSNWKKGILYIKRQEKMAGFESAYIDSNDIEIRVDTEADYNTSKCVHELFRVTSTHPLQHTKWNKAKFVLYPDYKFEIEYSWDQEWQYRVDSM